MHILFFLWSSSNDLKSSAFNDLKMWVFTNRSESPSASLVQIRSTPEFSNRLYRNMHNTLSRRGLMVLSLAWVIACHSKCRWYSLCTPERATQTSNSGQLCLLLCRAWSQGTAYGAIGAIRWNKPFNQSGTALWRSVHSWLLFGCEGRPPWIRRSGTRFQRWRNSR